MLWGQVLPASLKDLLKNLILPVALHFLLLISLY